MAAILQCAVVIISVDQVLAQSTLSQSFDEGWLFMRGPDPSSNQAKCTNKDFPIGKERALREMLCCCILFRVWFCFA